MGTRFRVPGIGYRVPGVYVFYFNIMDRRLFTKISAFGITGLFFPISGLFAKKKNPATVFEISGEPDKTIKKLFDELGGIRKLIKKDLSTATVLIKPNLCLPDKDKKATTTSSALIIALYKYLKEQETGRIIISDHTLQSSDRFDSIEIVKYLKDNPDLKLIFANEQRYFTPEKVNGKVLENTEILKLANKADFIINLATAKHHTATSVSLCTKNLMGMIWDRKLFHTQIDLHQAIGDLASHIKPDLNIIDANRVLLDRGPVGPGPVSIQNKIYVSTDIVAVDSVVVSKFNFGGKSQSPDKISHLMAAHQNGVGEIYLSNIELKQLNAV